MASVPGFSSYPLWSPQSQPGHHDGVSICLFDSVYWTLRLSSLPLVPSFCTPVNQCARRVPSDSTRHPRPPLRPLSRTSLPLPLYSNFSDLTLAFRRHAHRAKRLQVLLSMISTQPETFLPWVFDFLGDRELSTQVKMTIRCEDVHKVIGQIPPKLPRQSYASLRRRSWQLSAVYMTSIWPR
jgi:hypothetical protein